MQDDWIHIEQVKELTLRKRLYLTAVNNSYNNSKDIASSALSKDILVTRTAALKEVQGMAFPSGIYSSFVVPPSSAAACQWGVIFTICNVA